MTRRETASVLPAPAHAISWTCWSSGSASAELVIVARYRRGARRTRRRGSGGDGLRAVLVDQRAQLAFREADAELPAPELAPLVDRPDPALGGGELGVVTFGLAALALDHERRA